MPKILAAANVDNCKHNPSRSVVVHSPHTNSTHELAHVEQDTPEQDASQPRALDPARVSFSKHVEELGDIMNNEFPEPFATYVPTPVPPRPTRPTETAPDSPTDRTGCSRRGMKLPKELTGQDIDILLDPVPLPFDFSLSRCHTASHGNGEDDEQSDESSLWWYHPIFEARAKADIRRTLSALLPSDPSQDPPSPLRGVAGWKAEVRPRQSGARIWAERLEDAFGPGPLDRGLGRKPCRLAVSPSLQYQWSSPKSFGCMTPIHNRRVFVNPASSSYI